MNAANRKMINLLRYNAQHVPRTISLMTFSLISKRCTSSSMNSMRPLLSERNSPLMVANPIDREMARVHQPALEARSRLNPNFSR